MLRAGVTLNRLSQRLATVLPQAQRGAEYDRIAGLYDAVVGNGLYNRIVWGVRRADYRTAALSALDGAEDSERILDCGSGSAVFTAEAYRQAAPDGLVLFDRSLTMLRRAISRVPRLSAIQGDALDMPFEDEWFDRSVAWGLAHLFGSASSLFAELARVTRRGGQVHCTALVLSGRALGNRMLHGLVKRGEAAKAETADDYQTAFERFFSLSGRNQIGNMLFLSGVRP